MKYSEFSFSKSPMRQSHLSECSSCGGVSRESFAVAAPTLNNLQRGGSIRRLCSACVLRTHPSSFCPFCLHVYDETNPLPRRERVTCLSCPSISHSSCAAVSSPSFRCPPCCNPNLYFHMDFAEQLLAAAKISSISMSKAANLARAEADRRAVQAALARKKANDAVELYFSLTSENDRLIEYPKWIERWMVMR